jgi:hypothetical protein
MRKLNPVWTIANTYLDPFSIQYAMYRHSIKTKDKQQLSEAKAALKTGKKKLEENRDILKRLNANGAKLLTPNTIQEYLLPGIVIVGIVALLYIIRR